MFSKNQAQWINGHSKLILILLVSYP